MNPLPHRYRVTATGRFTGDVELAAGGLVTMRSASPPEFDGPGDRWSPETFLVGALADCFILTFRAIAAGSRLSWTSLACDVVGTLDRVDNVTQFTRFDIRAHLVIPRQDDGDRARHALEKAERHCLISRSLKGVVYLSAAVEPAEPAVQRGLAS